MGYIYYQVYEYFEDREGKRLIYTFGDEPAAHGLVEYLLKNDHMPIDLRVEEYETTT